MSKNAKIAILAGFGLLVALAIAYKARKRSQSEFVAFMKSIAPEIEDRYGIKPNITITQGSLESGFGQSGLASDGLNIYGIKVSKEWARDGLPVWTGLTQEFVNKVKGVALPLATPQAVTIKDSFKKYGSWRQSVLDWAELISGKYKTAYGFAKAGDLVGYGNAIYNTGYSTHPGYASLLQKTEKELKGYAV